MSQHPARARRLALLLLLLQAPGSWLRADEVLFLKDGRKLVVKRLERREGRVFFETPEGKTFFVAEQDVVSPPLARIPVVTAREIVLRDGRRIRALSLVREKGRVLFETPTGEVFSVPEGDVVAPPLASIPGRAAPRPAPALPSVPPPEAKAPAPVVPPPPPSPPPLTPPAQPPPFTTRFEPFPDRWAIPFPESPRIVKGNRLDPYRTSSLKGDRPVWGDAVFLNLALGLDLPFEARGSPVGVGVATPSSTSPDFVGEGTRLYTAPRATASVELFHGAAAFQPKDWAVKATGAFGLSSLRVASVPAGEAGRTRSDFALQEAFAEARLLTVSPQYDFLTLRAGIQPFVSDFRGFVFADADLGARLYGTAAGNRVQWNLGLFEMLAKRPETRLLTFDRLSRRVAVADLFVLDVFPGYRLGTSLHRTRDESGAAPLTVWHAGLVGEGPAGGLGLSHAVHVAWGRDEAQPLAGRPADVLAWMGAVEASLDRDWVRYRASFFYASGDGDAADERVRGFDAVQDLPVFAGSTDGFWARSGIALPGAGRLLKAQDSLLPSLRTSKFGRPSFVNPGLMLAGLGADLRLTPKLRARLGASFLQFARPASLERALGLPRVRQEIGLDLALGLRYRPRLDEHVALSLGAGALVPGKGWRDLEPAICAQPGCADAGRLWSGFLRVELLY